MYEVFIRAGYCASQLITNVSDPNAVVEVAWLDGISDNIVKVENVEIEEKRVEITGSGYYELRVFSKMKRDKE